MSENATQDNGTLEDLLGAEPETTAETPIEATMPYADKQAKAVKIAKELLAANTLQRDVELEVIAEDDKVLADLVKNELAKLDDEQKESPKQVVHSQEDIDKLPPGPREAIKQFIDQLGGIPKGGLFQVKLDGLDGMNAAVDTVIDNSALNLGTVVVGKIAAEKTAQIAQAICFLVNYANEIKAKKKPTVDEASTLKRVDDVIKRTFGEKDYKCALDLCRELASAQKKAKKQAAPKKAAEKPKGVKLRK